MGVVRRTGQGRLKCRALTDVPLAMTCKYPRFRPLFNAMQLLCPHLSRGTVKQSHNFKFVPKGQSVQILSEQSCIATTQRRVAISFCRRLVCMGSWTMPEWQRTSQPRRCTGGRDLKLKASVALSIFLHVKVTFNPNTRSRVFKHDIICVVLPSFLLHFFVHLDYVRMRMLVP